MKTLLAKLTLTLLLILSINVGFSQTRDSISKQQQLDRIKKEKLRNPVPISSQTKTQNHTKKHKKKKHVKKRHHHKRNSTSKK